MTALSRRTFLRLSAAASGCLVLAIDTDAAGAGPFEPSAWLRLAPDGGVTVIVAEAEIGQGVSTSIPMLVADALDADWSTVRFELAEADDKYGQQGTGGSTSIRRGAEMLREAGAVAREVLIDAAAERWSVAASACTTDKGVVVHPNGTTRLGYGELVAEASTRVVPKQPAVPAPPTRGVAGAPLARLDLPDKVNGAAVFGIDVKIPGALVSRVARCPVFGGKVRSFDEQAARAVPGVRHVVRIDAGVAVVADDYWAASRGLQQLAVRWDEGPAAKLDSAQIRAALLAALERPGAEARHHGDALAALATAAKVVEATYEVPFVAHAPMEPLNFTAHVTANRAELWGPTQVLTKARAAAAKVAGLPVDKVSVHPTLVGGGFGRRLEVDYVEEAVAIAKQVGVPVKLVWSRQDEVRHGHYRPTALSRFRAGLDAEGNLIAWHNRIASPSILASRGVTSGIDGTSVEGATELPYAVANHRVEYHRHDTAVPVGFWRSVGSSQNAFFTETFFDEVAKAAGRDPLAYRLERVTDARYRGVLELAAKHAGWGKPAPSGHHRGIAVAKSFGSYVAHVAEVSVTGANVAVHRLVCAIDCGRVVNPDTVRAQTEGGAIFGLSAALKSRITIERGRVKESNFHDFEVLRMHQTPDIEVHLVPSTAAWGGVGEPGVPPVAPAVANAIFAATGEPVRALPITLGAKTP